MGEQLMMDGPTENPVWMPREWIDISGIAALDVMLAGRGDVRYRRTRASHGKCEDCLHCIEQYRRGPVEPGWTIPGLARRAEWERVSGGGKTVTLHCEGHKRLRLRLENGNTPDADRRPEPSSKEQS